jgi:hypothetical protein
MAYTDAQGRPEIIADPFLKMGPAAWRPAPVGDADPAAETPPGGTPGAAAAEIRAENRQAG